jgi:putative SOS response-associated peptidase YedK
MCGRFTLHARPEDVARVFYVHLPLFEPRYNIAPSEVVGVVRETGQGREFAATKWGLIPHWSRESKGYSNHAGKVNEGHLANYCSDDATPIRLSFRFLRCHDATPVMIGA